MECFFFSFVFFFPVQHKPVKWVLKFKVKVNNVSTKQPRRALGEYRLRYKVIQHVFMCAIDNMNVDIIYIYWFSDQCVLLLLLFSFLDKIYQIFPNF